MTIQASTIQSFACSVGILLATVMPAAAEPVLRTEVAVNSAIVTVGDMFTNAGMDAERGLFRAPAPGTAGKVSVEVIRSAAKRLGITDFHYTSSRVNVARNGVEVTENTIKSMIEADLRQRGIVSEGVIARITLASAPITRFAADTKEPVRLTDLRYAPGSASFHARFVYAGVEAPIDLRGRLDLMIEAPHLTQSLPRGAILGASDIEMRPIQLAFAENGGLSQPQDLIGMQMKRPARVGMMVRPSDVAEPQIINRSELVTIFYRKGALRLTVKGQALNSAAKGEPVSVLNLVSKKVIHGIAADYGSVEMLSPGATGTKS